MNLFRIFTLIVFSVCLPAPVFADHPMMEGSSMKSGGPDMESGHSMHHHEPIILMPGEPAPELSIQVSKDPMSGWNLNIDTRNFSFSPEHASLPHIKGEGHAHLYVNNKKLARVYGAWFHISELPKGQVNIKVSLNANDHRPFMVNGRLVESSVSLEVGAETAK